MGNFLHPRELDILDITSVMDGPNWNLFFFSGCPSFPCGSKHWAATSSFNTLTPRINQAECACMEGSLLPQRRSNGFIRLFIHSFIPTDTYLCPWAGRGAPSPYTSSVMSVHNWPARWARYQLYTWTLTCKIALQLQPTASPLSCNQPSVSLWEVPFNVSLSGLRCAPGTH